MECWNEAGVAFRFTLRPHFYQTYWFYGLVGVALFGLTYLAYRRRLSVLRQERARSRSSRASSSPRRRRAATDRGGVCTMAWGNG